MNEILYYTIGITIKSTNKNNFKYYPQKKSLRLYNLKINITY